MPALLMLAGALGLNYGRHRCGLSTICSTLRPVVKPWQMVALWAAITAWFLPHYGRPAIRALTTAVAETLDDLHDVFED
jgi:hypothetical protein